jgi:hypothetical protein
MNMRGCGTRMSARMLKNHERCDDTQKEHDMFSKSRG